MEVPPNYCNPMMTRRANVVKGGGRRSKYQRPGMEEPLVGLEVEDRKERRMMVTGAIIGGELSPRNLSPFSCVLVIGRVLPGASFWPGGWERNLLVGVQSSLANDKEALVFIFAWGSGVGRGASERRVREQCAMCMAG